VETSQLFDRIAIHKQDLVDGFTKKFGVHTLVYSEFHQTMADPILREIRLKKWHRAWKVRLIHAMNPEWIDLFDERTGAILDGPADIARLRRWQRPEQSCRGWPPIPSRSLRSRSARP
jgi:putative endonuclease